FKYMGSPMNSTLRMCYDNPVTHERSNKCHGLCVNVSRCCLSSPGREDVVSTLDGKQGKIDAAGRARVNVQEFQTFYQENLGLIYRYVYSKVGNREEAEDLTSQIFIKAVRGVDTGRGLMSMQKWLFQVARTTIADYWRAHYRVTTSSLEELFDGGWE